MPKILLTGASGYIGGHLLTELLKDEKNSIIILVRPTSDLTQISNYNGRIKISEYTGFDSLNGLMKQEGEVDLVIHLAGYVGAGLIENEVEPNIEGNLILAAHLFEAMRLNGVKNIINTGSYWEFGDRHKHVPKTVYAIYKETVRELLGRYVDSFGFSALNLILYDVYGEDDQRNKIIPTLMKLKPIEKISMTPGNQKLSFVHIQDVIQGYEKAIDLILDRDKRFKERTFHLYNKDVITLRNLVEKIERIIGQNITVIWGDKHYNNFQIMDPKLPNSVFPGWEVKIDIENGLRKIFTQ